jgi:hypothetical protein
MLSMACLARASGLVEEYLLGNCEKGNLVRDGHEDDPRHECL